MNPNYPFILTPEARPKREVTPKLAFDKMVNETKPIIDEFLTTLEQLKASIWVYFIGHPGAGKSTILEILKLLLGQYRFNFWHVDDYIDWPKLVEWVNRMPHLSEDDYVKTANRAVLNFATCNDNHKTLNFIDGAGLIEDMKDIFFENGIDNCFYVVVDAPPNVLEKRLETRGDGFTVTEKETRDRNLNIQAMSNFNHLYLNTEDLNLELPKKEICQILQNVKNYVIEKSLTDQAQGF